MTVPTASFTAIADGDIDPESPLTVTLMTAYRDRDENLRQWMGGSYTAAIDHNHDGVNSTLLSGNVAGVIFLHNRMG